MATGRWCGHGLTAVCGQRELSSRWFPGTAPLGGSAWRLVQQCNCDRHQSSVSPPLSPPCAPFRMRG